MLLDTRTVDSLHDLAAVVQDYTTPSRGSRPLKQEEKNKACFLRWQNGWHAHHIAEAMGLSQAQRANAWGIDIMEAIEGCTTRSDWNSQGIFLRAIDTPAGPDQSTLAGPNTFGEYRRTARRNAIIQAALLGEISSGGTLVQKAGKDRDATELAAAADLILRREKNQGHYRHTTFGKTHINQVAVLIAELGTLFDWVGKGREIGMGGLPDEARIKIDDEIIKRCEAQKKLTPAGLPQGFFKRIEREVYTTTPCCGLDGKETMKAFGYPAITRGYASELCREKDIFKARPGVRTQILDPENQKKVKAAIGTGRPIVSRIQKETGFNEYIVVGILAELGYGKPTSTSAAIRKIILPLHDNKKLTPTEMWNQTPRLRKLMGGTKLTSISTIFGLLQRSTPERTPWTRARREQEQRIPLLVNQLKDFFLAYLREQDEVWLDRVRGNISRSQRAGSLYEDTGYTVDSLAAAPGWNETPALTRRVLALLVAETPQLVALRGDDIVIPFSGLRWITTGGEGRR